MSKKEGYLSLIDLILRGTRAYEKASGQEEKQRLAIEVLESCKNLSSLLTAPVWRDAHRVFKPTADGIEITPESQRNYIANILKHNWPLTMEVRYSLIYGLRALNVGETFPLFMPKNTSAGAKIYMISAWKFMACLHVERLSAEGMKKGAARNIVAEAYGYEGRGETVRKWENRDVVEVFEKKWMKNWCTIVKGIAPLAHENNDPADVEDTMDMRWYKGIFCERNSLSQCGKNFRLAKTGKNVPLPDFLFMPVLPID